MLYSYDVIYTHVMTHRIAVANQKGGVGKTTTTLNTAGATAAAGLRTLMIDLDPQGHLSEAAGIGDEALASPMTLAGLITNQWDDKPSLITREVSSNLWIIPTNEDMFLLEAQLYGRTGREFLLSQRLIDRLSDDYDVIFIDCPPSLGVLTDAALVAAREDPGEGNTGSMIIPTQAEDSARKALKLLLKQVRTLEAAFGLRMDTAGLVINAYDKRKGNLVTETYEALHSIPHLDVLSTIGDRKEMRLSWANGQSVEAYAPHSDAADWYRDLARFVVERHVGGNWDGR